MNFAIKILLITVISYLIGFFTGVKFEKYLEHRKKIECRQNEIEKIKKEVEILKTKI